MTSLAIANSLNITTDLLCVKKQQQWIVAEMRSIACKYCNSSLLSKHQARANQSSALSFCAASVMRLRAVIGGAAASLKYFGYGALESPRKYQKPCVTTTISTIPNYHNDDGRSTQTGRVRALSMFEQFSDRRIESAMDFPRPEEIPWQKNLVNNVNLIGLLGKDPEIKYFDTGRICARSSLAVRKSSDFDESPSWFILEFWNELAEVAAHHLKKGHKIHVAGRVVVDIVGGEDQVSKTYVKVIVSNLNYIDLPKEGKPKRMGSEDQKLSTEKLWQAFFLSPGEWWDNRNKKKNPKSPDFKHRSSGEALWIEGWNTPSWVNSQLEALDSKGAFGRELSTSDSFSNRSSFDDHDFPGF
ncbi:hypothetical protein O6H91_13G010900 [Diphasiastrum complanatum]|uniref:Uncharacterized protein n=1 Tax=Diphasiastrum complanatum TaxID=34168 RepID=A0ACC2BS47_DIPCM|nr:hypothetical protein O6H91_13G010900 [Diphasiastrum complanatum]